MDGKKERATEVVPAPLASSLAGVCIATLASLAAFAALALLLTSHHALADRVLARLPVPGPARSLAAARNLRAQLRIEPPKVWRTRLRDNTEALVAEARVTNDSFIAVRDVVVSAEAYLAGRRVATRSSACGKALSPTLLGRIKREELAVVLDLPPNRAAIEPGMATNCQVAFSKRGLRADEVAVRIASVEPLPGHREARFLAQE